MKEIPSLNEAIIGAKSVPECVLNQVNILKNKPDLEYVIFANKLANYYIYITDRKLLKAQRAHFNNFYDEINKTYPELLFRIEGRRKAFLSAYKKLWKSSSDSILKDIAAFRITLFGDNPIQLMRTCYTVAEHLISYSVQHGFVPCPAEKEKEINGFDPKEHPDVIIPESSLLSADMEQYVKDYIFHPKADEYQSLHIIFKDNDLNFFEVQIRTIFMHMNAEVGPANHKLYKLKYDSLKIDRNIIQIPGYHIENGHVFDWVGFEESLEILRRQKTY